ncbi:MAG: hypothetical protein ABFS19_07060 [Thermodesulfobacteriota bacterium]
MTTQLKTTQKTKTDLNYEASKFVLGVGMISAALIGLWGAACLVSGLLNGGLGAMAKGYFTAITGM